jgi:hypothetical protein
MTQTNLANSPASPGRGTHELEALRLRSRDSGSESASGQPELSLGLAAVPVWHSLPP